MRIAVFAASMAVILSASGLAALTANRGTPHFAASPTRPHVTLGAVAVLIRPEPDAAAATPLAAAARARYGRVDALAHVHVAPLPFDDAALLTGLALRWE